MSQNQENFDMSLQKSNDPFYSTQNSNASVSWPRFGYTNRLRQSVSLRLANTSNQGRKSE